MQSSSSDKELMLRLRKDGGHRDAYRILFERHYAYLCDQASLRLEGDKVLAEEVVQQVFIDFWVQKLYMNVETSAGAFLSRMVRFRVIDMKRKGSRRVEVETDFGNDYLQYEGEDITNPAESADIKKALHAAIAELPEDRRKIFIGVYLEDKSYREVAEEFGVSINTVKTQMRRSLDKLRERLKDFMILSPLFYILHDLILTYGTK
jgi:RNA polymerase sigma factor (sigma-70 family)